MTSIAADVDARAPADSSAAAVKVSAAPQSPQNLLPDGLSAPHAGQRKISGAPQWPQILLPSGLTLPQLGQSISHPIKLLIYTSSHRFPSKSEPSERDIAL
nr:hypothetical protein [Bradyrhizobium lablabi]